MIDENDPLITIIIPVYNVSTYLDSSMQTVVSQTYQNLEIILIDDGSTDHSGEKCDIWVQKDPRIQVIHQENKGLSEARNVGLDSASGEYILFFDSDDQMSSDLCQTLLDAMTPDVNIAVCDCEHIFEEQTYEFPICPKVFTMSAEEAIQKIWYQTGFLPSAWAKLYRKTVFEAHRFTPNIYFEDVDIIHELIWTAEKIAYTPSRLYGYVHREGSITTNVFSEKEFDILKIVDKILTFAQDKPTLIPAAQAYATTAAFRIYLNTPRIPRFADKIVQAEELIKRYGRDVLMDRNIRRKNRYALCLYFACKPLLFCVYKFVDRWKS